LVGNAAVNSDFPGRFVPRFVVLEAGAASAQRRLAKTCHGESLMKSNQPLSNIERHAERSRESHADGLREQPRIVTLGDLDVVQNGYNGNNYDWSEWYYYDY
jgi:hypothetical protein